VTVLSELTAVTAAYRRRRFTWLFCSLLLTLGAGSTLEELAPRYNPLELLLAVNLLAAIASVAHEGHMRLPLLLGIAFVTARILRTAFGVPGMVPIADGLWFVAIALAMVVSLRHALGSGVVNAERILAALDAYLLLGLLFAFVYWALERTWPASFAGAAGSLDQPHAIYFSFVTIATLGYGDVVPASPPARGLAIVEALTGQMYLAVLVARLVALYSQPRND
jgi:hypothetical protein